jgi:hypothetical protein
MAVCISENKTANYGEQVFNNVRDISCYSVLAGLIGLGFSCFMAGSWAGVGIVAITALACYIIGSGFGFLFSIPRSAQESGKTPASPGTSTNIILIPRDNTNLEQISDWLVKIIIGASLVQLREVKALLVATADSLGKAIAAVGATCGNLPGHAGSGEFCLFLILYFLTLGFLTGYLITKLWLPYVMLRSSLAMVSLQVEAMEEQARKEGARGIMLQFGLTGPDQPPVKNENIKLATAPVLVDLNDDPNKGKFGGKPEAAGLKLSAEVTKLEDIDDDYFRIALKVTADKSRTLDKPVTFHLHPTFNPAEVKLLPANNAVSLVRAAWGAFTVGVTIEGEATQLELDLAQLPGVPLLFKSR